MCEACWREDEIVDAAEEADKCVAAGIAWLDREGPANWREMIDLDTLDIDLPKDCVLGQVFRSYACNPVYTWTSWRGIEQEHGSGYEYAVREHLFRHFSDSVTGPLGFSGYPGITAADMTAAWIRALAV